MTITRALLIFLLSCSSIALASQHQDPAKTASTAVASELQEADPCAVTLRGQVKDPVGCTLHLASVRP